MCGIAGIYSRLTGAPADGRRAAAMLYTLRHRGPESAAMLLDGPVALGHDRLSIIDLEHGLQPIGNEDGSVWVICNGEVFNYIELREELQARGHRFRTGSDCEVILHLYEERGADCVHALVGQFAFALWDSARRLLFLARDRLGVRPLFYTQAGDDFLFASEIKALLSEPRVVAEIDPEAVDEVFTYWSPLPGRTAFRGIRELPAGHYMLVTPTAISTRRYWSVDFAPAPVKSERYYTERLLELLVDATRLRLRSDVPVGAYLSGGLDSTSIAAIVRRYTSNPLKTFSIAFGDRQFDERQHQARMAAALGTEHLSIECSDEDIGRVFPDAVMHAETPLLRTAPAPMFLLSKLVRDSGLKVVLTGEGSDEFLGGYDIFKETLVRRFWASEPQSARRPLLLRRLYADVQGIGDSAQAYLEAFFRNGLAETTDPAYSHLVRWRSTSRAKRFFSPETRAALASYNPARAQAAALDGLSDGWDALSKAQFIESRIFLSQYLLSSQGDRPAMAHAVEGRFPFLDHRLIEFAASIPPYLRLRGLNEKYLLKRAMSDLVPAEVLARTKRPYRAPIRNAFFGERAPSYVRDALSPEQVKAAGLFDPPAVSSLVRKCAAAPSVSEADGMALVGILSTQLLHRHFVQTRARWTQPARDFAVTTVKKTALDGALAQV